MMRKAIHRYAQATRFGEIYGWAAAIDRASGLAGETDAFGQKARIWDRWPEDNDPSGSARDTRIAIWGAVAAAIPTFRPYAMLLVGSEIERYGEWAGGYLGGAGIVREAYHSALVSALVAEERPAAIAAWQALRSLSQRTGLPTVAVGSRLEVERTQHDAQRPWLPTLRRRFEPAGRTLKVVSEEGQWVLRSPEDRAQMPLAEHKLLELWTSDGSEGPQIAGLTPHLMLKLPDFEIESLPLIASTIAPLRPADAEQLLEMCRWLDDSQGRLRRADQVHRVAERLRGVSDIAELRDTFAEDVDDGVAERAADHVAEAMESTVTRILAGACLVAVTGGRWMVTDLVDELVQLQEDDSVLDSGRVFQFLRIEQLLADFNCIGIWPGEFGSSLWRRYANWVEGAIREGGVDVIAPGQQPRYQEFVWQAAGAANAPAPATLLIEGDRATLSIENLGSQWRLTLVNLHLDKMRRLRLEVWGTEPGQRAALRFADLQNGAWYVPHEQISGIHRVEMIVGGEGDVHV
jgi:hypothetical protein